MSACSQLISICSITPHLSEVIKRSPENVGYGQGPWWVWRLWKSFQEHRRERCGDPVKSHTTASHDYLLLTAAADCCVLLIAIAPPHGDGRDSDIVGEAVWDDTFCQLLDSRGGLLMGEQQVRWVGALCASDVICQLMFCDDTPFFVILFYELSSTKSALAARTRHMRKTQVFQFCCPTSRYKTSFDIGKDVVLKIKGRNSFVWSDLLKCLSSPTS